MRTFAIVGEGLTDQVVIENILNGLFEDPNVRFVQPTLDLTDASRKAGAGGWTEVFRFCDSELLADAFAANDFVIIQIDTDVCSERGFDVSSTVDGEPLECRELVEAVCKRLHEAIDSNLLFEAEEKIIFAVCVNSIECWLLPLLFDTKAHYGKTTGCLEAVNSALNKRNAGYYLHSKAEEYYSMLSNPYSKRKNIERNYKKNPSLKIFVESLKAIPDEASK